VNNIFAKNLSFLLSLAALAQIAAVIGVVSVPAHAQTIDIIRTDAEALPSIGEMSPQPIETASLASETPSAAQTPSTVVKVPVIDSLALSVSQPTVAASDAQPSLPEAMPAANESNRIGLENNNEMTQVEQITTTQEAAPIPGTTATSAAPLTTETPAPQQAPASKTDNGDLAQIDVDPGTPTFGGDSYIGIAGNLGLGGDSALGDSSFMVISKIGLTTRIAVRPSVAIESDPVILVPVTFDFSIRPVDAFTERLPIAPYVGGGVAISTGDNSDIGPLLTAGVDVPITSRFTATAAVNAALLDDVAVGVMLGIGYNFSALGI
jgi:hypothetical protein